VEWNARLRERRAEHRMMPKIDAIFVATELKPTLSHIV
jgi:hypothetical protein